MYFVHPGGWFELLGEWQTACLDILFEEEPEMAGYVVGMGHIHLNEDGMGVSWWPPTWHSQSQQWLQSLSPPDPESEYVAEPVDLNLYRPQGMPPLGTASDGYSARHSMDAVGMDWIYQQMDFPHPARDGQDRWSRSPSRNRGRSSQDRARDGSPPTRSKGRGKATASDGNQGRSRSTASDGYQGRGRSRARDGGEPASSSTSRDQAYVCAWERREHLGPNPAAPPNPNRYMARGFASSQRRQQRRQLARDGQEVPDHLQPRKIEISKSLKRQMWELQQRARKMACGELTEEDVEEEEEKSKEWIEKNRMDEEKAKEEKKQRLKDVKEELPDFASDGNASMPEAKEEEQHTPFLEEEEEPAQPRRQWHSSSKGKKEGTPATGGEKGKFAEPEMATKKEKKASDGDQEKKEEEEEPPGPPAGGPPKEPKEPPGPPSGPAPPPDNRS